MIQFSRIQFELIKNYERYVYSLYPLVLGGSYLLFHRASACLEMNEEIRKAIQK
jgi:hypothetical protein